MSITAVACLAGGIAACSDGGGDGGGGGGGEDDPSKVVLADFEEWAPDFQILRTMENFGAVDVNENTDYVKSGKQSAKLYVMGNEGSSLKPYIYLPTVSDYFHFDHSKFEKFDKVSAWLYNPNEAGLKVEIGAITTIKDITTATQVKGTIKELAQGWNEIVWNVNASFIATATGFSAYDGVNGVYFKFDATGAETKADATVFYLDDVVLHYGETEQTIRKLSSDEVDREDASVTYAAYSDQVRYTNFDPIPLNDLEGKALHIELKLHGDGMAQIGYSRSIDWGHLSGLARITKKGDKYTSTDIEGNPIGKVTPLTNGWISFDFNYSEWYGAYLHEPGSTQVEMVLNEGTWEPYVDISIFWLSLKVIDAYEPPAPDFPERPDAIKYEAGSDYLRYTRFTPIALDDLVGKAISIQLKLLEDGEVTVGFLASDWAEIAYMVNVEKSGDTYTARNFWNDTPYGKINVLEDGDGWVELVVDYADFKPASVAAYTEISMIYLTGHEGTAHEKPLPTGVGVDWSSLKITDAYGEYIPPDFPDRPGAIIVPKDVVNGTPAASVNFTAIPISELQDKAVHLEFYFKEEGTVGFALCDATGDWFNATGPVLLTYDGSTVTASKGVVSALTEGWWAWEMNFYNFEGNGLSGATKVDVFTKDWGTDWGAAFAVDARAFRAVDENDQDAPPVVVDPDHPNTAVFGGGDSLAFNTDIPVEELAGKAIHFEFKMDSDEAEFGFSIAYRATWANCSGPIVVKKVSGQWVSLSWVDGAPYGKLVPLANGWYAWECNRADWTIDRQANGWSQNPPSVGLLVRTAAQVGTVTVDLDSLKVVDSFIVNRDTATVTSGTSTLTFNKKMKVGLLEGTAIHFEFQMGSDTTEFGFALGEASTWANCTGGVLIKKINGEWVSLSSIGSNGDFSDAFNGVTYGRVIELGDGWYAWECNRTDWTSDRKADGWTRYVVQDVNFLMAQDTQKGTVTVDLNSLCLVNALETPDHPNTRIYGAGESFERHTITPILLSDVQGAGAISVDLKLFNDGAFTFALCAGTWAELSFLVVVEKQGDTYTTHRFYEGTTIGKVVVLEEGWIRVIINYSEFDHSKLGEVQEIHHIYVTGGTDKASSHQQPFTIGVSVDCGSIKTTETYHREVTIAPDAVDGEAGSKFVFNAIPVKELEGRAIHVEFRFEHEGTFAFAICCDDWKNATGSIYLTYAGGTVTASEGRVYALGDGWWAWELNFANFGGDGFQHGIAQVETFMKGWGITPDMEIIVDIVSFRTVNAI